MQSISSPQAVQHPSMICVVSASNANGFQPSFLPSSTRGLSHSLICIAQEQQSSISGDFSWNALRTFTYVAELVGFISAPQRSHTRFVAILLALHSCPQQLRVQFDRQRVLYHTGVCLPARLCRQPPVCMVPARADRHEDLSCAFSGHALPSVSSAELRVSTHNSPALLSQ